MKTKKLFALLLTVLMVMAMLSGCGKKEEPTPEPTPSTEPTEEKVAVTVTVWGPQEDQSADNGNWLSTECEKFAADHPEWDITFKYGVCSEGDAKTSVTTDPSAAADVYMFANDQIPDLVKANAIAKLGGSTVDAIKKNNTATTVNTVTYDGAIYGVPFTGNTWFMFYDKSVFTEEDVKSLDAMLEKGKVAFPLDNSWYLASFYVGNGCTLFGDGTDEAAGIDFSGDKAVAVTNYLIDLFANPNFANGDVNSVSDANAFFSGAWDIEKAQTAYKDNLGICAAPSFTIDGQLKQMKAFAGSKAIGVNPATSLYKEHPEIAVALAAYLGSTSAQKDHFDLRSTIPTDVSISVGDNALAKAQMDTMDYASIVQPLIASMSQYWGPAGSMGQEIVAGTVTHDNAADKTAAMNEQMNSTGVS